MTLDAGLIPKPLVLVGFMASGKSTIGPVLAALLKLDFLDADRTIEEAAGLTISEIFRERGEKSFRDAERETLRAMLVGSPKVIAAGGGAFADPITRQLLIAGALTIWLDPPFAVIRARLHHSSGRPMAAARTEVELYELWSERRSYYAQASMHVPILQDSAARVANDIAERLGDFIQSP